MTTIDPLGVVAHRVPVNVLRLQAQARGDHLFLVDDDAALTYAAVDDLADRYASGFSDLGVGKGDTVAILMENSTAMAVTAFGVNRLGAIWSPVSTDYRGEWLRELLTSIGSINCVGSALPNRGARSVLVSASRVCMVTGAMPVMTPVGCTVFTRMLCAASSLASATLIPTMPCLDAV